MMGLAKLATSCVTFARVIAFWPPPRRSRRQRQQQRQRQQICAHTKSLWGASLAEFDRIMIDAAARR